MRQYLYKMNIEDIRMLRCMCGHIRVKKKDIAQKVYMTEISDKIKKSRLRWFGHVVRRPRHVAAHKYNNLLVKRVKRGRGKLKSTWKKLVVRDLRTLDVKTDLVQKRFKWKCKIHINKVFKVCGEYLGVFIQPVPTSLELKFC